jgi:hypothetical protein
MPWFGGGLELGVVLNDDESVPLESRPSAVPRPVAGAVVPSWPRRF